MPKPFGEKLFLIPPPICKCGGKDFNRDTEKLICKACGKTYRSPLGRNILCVLVLIPWFIEEYFRERKAKREDLKNRRHCTKHGFERTLTLPKDGREITVCMKCLAEAMATPVDGSIKTKCAVCHCDIQIYSRQEPICEDCYGTDAYADWVYENNRRPIEVDTNTYDESCKDSCLLYGCNCNRKPCTDACLIHGCDHD